jgi:hypothetical protein
MGLWTPCTFKLKHLMHLLHLLLLQYYSEELNLQTVSIDFSIAASLGVKREWLNFNRDLAIFFPVNSF